MKSFKFFSAFLLFFIFPKCIFAQAIDVQKDSGLGDQIKMVSERIRLSYVDPDRCSQLLNFYGVNIGDPKKPIDKSKLPVVVVIPQTSFHETIPDHEKVFPQTETDPINEILLFYNPAKPEDAGRIREIIISQVDLPAA